MNPRCVRRPLPRLALLPLLACIALSACSSDLDSEPTRPTAPSGTAEPPGTSPGATALSPDATVPDATGLDADDNEPDPDATGPDPGPEGEPTGAPPDTVDASLVADAAARTDAVFSGLVRDEPGCTWAVGIDGEVVHRGARGAASIDPLTPMTTDTIVDIGSTSKQFTATAIVLLAQRGELALDDTLASFLPDLPDWAAEVTIRQMVHHTSGIPDYIVLLLDEGFDYGDVTTDDDTLAALRQVTELDFPPDDHFEYSNSNYFLLGQVVTAVMGASLGEVLADEVFTPLGLDMVMDPTAVLAGKATSYEWDDDAATWVVADSPWEQTGDGGVQTTPSELVRWAAEWWAPTVGGPEVNEVRLGDTVEAAEGIGYGYGMGLYEDPTLGAVLTHSGGWAGFVTSFVVLPEDHLAVSAACTAAELDVMQSDVGIDIATIWHAALHPEGGDDAPGD
jgi:CubicO group peptidase (beta-lactamase class C family)